MNRRRIVLYQAGAWALIIGYDLLRICTSRPRPPNLRQELLWQATFMLSLVSLFYYCFLFVFPQGLRRGRWLGLGLLGTPVVFAATRYVLQEILLPLAFGFHNYTPDVSLLGYLQDNAYFLPPTVVLAGAAVGIRDAFLREKERENQLLLQVLTQEKTQAELAFLKTQINPHFLYNTLNYLYAEAYAVSEPLAGAVLRLSDLMRYMLHEGPDGRVELRREVEYLENYLALHRLRFEDQFFVNFHQPAALGGQRVAALLLVPFVENALKHGVLHRPDQPVDICLALPAPGRLCFEVRNRVGPHQRDATTGIGLANLRRRLALLYPGRHALEVSNDGTEHYTRLELDLVPAA